MLKKILLLMVFVMFFCCGCIKPKREPLPNALENIQKRGNVIVGVRVDAYPFGYKDENGKYTGYDIDIANLIGDAIFGEEGKVKFVPVTASDRMMKLLSEDVDMIIAAMSVTPGRLQILDFSDPYYIAGQALLVRQGSKIKGIRDLNGKKAIVVFGSSGEISLRAAVPNVDITGYKTYDEALKGLISGKADAIVSDDTILIGLALKNSGLKLLPKRYSREPYGVAFRKGVESEDIIKLVNGVINDSSRNGTLRKLQQKYRIKKY